MSPADSFVQDLPGTLFAADANTGALYVFSTATGEVLKRIDIGTGVLDVLYGGQDEIFVTWRGATEEAPDGSGGLTVVSGADYSVVRSLAMPLHPNSLALSPDGARLFVTVKNGAPKGPARMDSILRLDLNALRQMPH